jgi:hypothetical protein
MAAIAQGTSCLFGIAGTELTTPLFVQSYTVSASFNSEAMVTDETGITKTMRFDDRKTELTLEGVVKSAATGSPAPILGANLTFTVAAKGAYPSGTASNTFFGVITKVEEKGATKDFVKYSITAVDFEGVTPA